MRIAGGSYTIVSGGDAIRAKHSSHESLGYVKDHERLARVNEIIRQRMKELGEKMPLRFLTPSLYEDK